MLGLGCGKKIDNIDNFMREEKSFLDLAKKMLKERIIGHKFEQNGIEVKF